MSYKLFFIKKAKKEWDKLNSSIKEQFKKKLKERLQNPIVPADKLSGYENIYKIKLRSSGYRLAYEVRADKVIIVILAVGKRENSAVYKSLQKRLDYKDEIWFLFLRLSFLNILLTTKERLDIIAIILF